MRKFGWSFRSSTRPRSSATSSARRKRCSNVVRVDDGSVDDSALPRRRERGCGRRAPPRQPRAGAALQTGFDYALTDPKMRWVVTFDADGQHQIDDVVAMLDLARAEGLDVVFVALPRRPHRGRVRQEARADGRGLHEPHHQDPAHRRPQRPAADFARRRRHEIMQNRMAYASELVAQIGP